MAIEVLDFQSTDLELARTRIDEFYGSDRPVSWAGDTGGFACAFRFATAGEVGADRVSYALGAEASVYLPSTFVAVVGRRGAMRVRTREQEVVLRRGGAALYPQDPFETAWSAVDLDSVRLPAAAVARFAVERSGVSAAVFRFTGLAPTSAADTALWRAVSDHIHREVVRVPSLLDNPLIQAAQVDLLAATALSVFPNTAMTGEYRRDPGWVGPATLRRAVEYIRANLAATITLTDIAAAAQVTPRALQIAFRRHYGTTPMHYLRDRRLESVHAELTAADPDRATVGDVAGRWGFGERARFAEHYQRRYGQPPERTLLT